MVWNKDLAKLKQVLKSEEDVAPKKPAPKPIPKPAAPREIEDEDALFLAAMGQRKEKTPAPSPALPPSAPAEAPRPEPPAGFAEAMASMKGLKPVAPQLRVTPPKPAAPPEPKDTAPAAPAPQAQPPAPPVPEPEPQPEPQAPARTLPAAIQLAAGMAIDVDGTLDLKGHAPVDAVERLKERILDGHLLGWRTLHVQLGSSDELKQAFLDFLGTPEAELIARYAQAPIPMGGSQAWILYLGISVATH